jgi:hypothetical protein
MAMIIALFVSSNFALYHELSKEVLEKTNAVAVVSYLTIYAICIYENPLTVSFVRPLAERSWESREPGSMP